MIIRRQRVSFLWSTSLFLPASEFIIKIGSKPSNKAVNKSQLVVLSNMNGVFNELTVCDNVLHIIPYSYTYLSAIHGLITVITKFANSIK